LELKLIKKQILENVEIECYEDMLSVNKDLFMTRKQIGNSLEYPNLNSLHKLIQRNKIIIGNPIITGVLSDKIAKLYSTELYSIKQILIILSFTNSLKTNDLINGFSKMIGHAPVRITSRYELDFDKILFKTFKDIIDIKRQFCINNYRVDWYISKYNIVIECDEYGHSGYINDIQRTELINKELHNPTWIRFNPNDNNFDIGNILNSILHNCLIAK